jgi:hypothetical protein
MDYGKIIGRAWEITKKYRWLWWLGLLALWAEGFATAPTNMFDSNNGIVPTDQTNQSDLFQRFMPATPASGDQSASIFNLFPKIHAASDAAITNAQYKEEMQKIATYFADNIWIAALIIIFMIAIGLLIAYISYSAKAGLILSVKNIEATKKELGFKKAYHEGRDYVWKLFGQDVVVGLIIGFAFALLALLCFLPWIISPTDSSILYGILLGVILILPAIVATIYIGILLKTASRAIVIDKMGIFDSIAHSQKIVRNNLGNVIVLWLIQVGISLAVSLILMLFVFFIVIIMVLAGAISALASPLLGAVIISILLVAIIAALLFASGVFNTFLSSYWTLTYRALDYLASNKK